VTTEEKIKHIVAEQLLIDDSQVTATSHLVDDLGADSLDILEVAMSIEEAFDIEISDDDIEKADTVQDVIDYVTKRINSKVAAMYINALKR
jgi:acyl carrier protein